MAQIIQPQGYVKQLASKYWLKQIRIYSHKGLTGL